MVLIRDFAPARSRFGMNGEMACAAPTIFLRTLWLTFPDQLNGGSFAGGYIANVHIALSYCPASRRIAAVEAARTIVMNGMGILGLAHEGSHSTQRLLIRP